MRTAVVCVAKNEDRYIKEWAEYHLKLGFTSVYIYQNDWRCSLEMENVTKRVVDGKIIQVKAYNSFIKKNQALPDLDGRKYDWIAFIDVDEFIVLSNHATIGQFIEWMLATHGPTDSIGLHWVFFGDNGIKEDDGAEGTLSRFTKRGLSNRHRKTLVNGKRKKAFTFKVHEGSLPSLNTLGNRPPNMHKTNIQGSYPIDVARINHYFTKTKKEFRAKMARGRADQLSKRDLKDADFDRLQKNHNIVDDFEARDFMYPPNDGTV